MGPTSAAKAGTDSLVAPEEPADGETDGEADGEAELVVGRGEEVDSAVGDWPSAVEQAVTAKAAEASARSSDPERATSPPYVGRSDSPGEAFLPPSQGTVP